MEQQNAGKLTDFSLFVPVVLMLFLVRPGHPWEKNAAKKTAERHFGQNSVHPCQCLDSYHLFTMATWDSTSHCSNLVETFVIIGRVSPIFARLSL
jgi:hypothetical protein